MGTKLRDAEIPEILTSLGNMSHGAFRECSKRMAEYELPSASISNERFWQLFIGIVPTNAKAYLGTFLKAAVKRYADGRLSIMEVPELLQFAELASAIDKRKVLDAFLPKVKSSSEVDLLLCRFVEDSPKGRVNALLKVDTCVAHYSLFRELRQQEGDVELIRQTALSLMRKQTQLSFNMASIIQAYFGLDALPGTFSLRLCPYELSLLERSEEDFVKVLRS